MTWGLTFLPLCALFMRLGVQKKEMPQGGGKDESPWQPPVTVDTLVGLRKLSK